MKNSWENISAAGTYVLRTGRCSLARIVVNTTAAGAITVYDNTAASGKKVATLKSNVVENTYNYEVELAKGLTVVTAAASDITVVFS